MTLRASTSRYVTAAQLRGEWWIYVWHFEQVDGLLDELERQGADPQYDITPEEAVRIGRAAVRRAWKIEEEDCVK